MNSIKQFFSSSWDKVIGACIVIFGIVLYILNLKNKENDALKAQVENIKDQKQADVLQAQVQESLTDANLKQSEIKNQQKTLDSIETKREELPKDNNLTPSQIEQYWNKPQ